MGKQSRRKRERTAGEAKAFRYLGRLGLTDHPDPGPYRRMAEQDPEWFRLVSETDDAAVALAERDDASPKQILELNQARYRLVYRDLDTALAEYASRPVMIAADWLVWWLDHAPPATRILDVGCGPGVLTCAYALALPEVEVVGIDVLPEAVACAEELAGRAGAGNVSFVVGDAFDPEVAAGTGDVDQLVAVTALADAGIYPQYAPPGPDPFSTVADVDGPGRAFQSPGVAGLAGRLSPGGSLLAFDRTSDASQAVRFGAALLNAGIGLDFRQAGVVLFVEEDVPSTFTRFVGTRAAVAPPASAGAALAAWLKSVEPPAYGESWNDEVRFEALKSGGARLVWGCEIDYDPHSPMVERREIWRHGDDAYGWIATTTGLRELYSGHPPEALWQEFSRYAVSLNSRGVKVRFYEGEVAQGSGPS
ncbi:MAG: class I SAM-dependent methyltransferase [Actinobacteria bacterium]|nr:class I SAM-dependent methyltransferase [Actinomycetota bacterium]